MIKYEKDNELGHWLTIGFFVVHLVRLQRNWSGLGLGGGFGLTDTDFTVYIDLVFYHFAIMFPLQKDK